MIYYVYINERKAMAKTAAIYVKIEPEVKKEADEVMGKLGLSASTVINMLYRQIAMEKRIPFESRITYDDMGRPMRDGVVDLSLMTEDQLKAEAERWKKAIYGPHDDEEYISWSELKANLEKRLSRV